MQRFAFMQAISMKRALIVLFLLSVSLSAEEAKAPRVLWIFSWHKDMPWQREVETGFENHFKFISSSPNIYTEYMDAGRFSTQQQVHVFEDYIRNKYQDQVLDYVIFESEPAAIFYEQNPDLFEGAEILVLNHDIALPMDNPSSKLITINLDFDASYKALNLLEPNKTIYLISGASDEEIIRVKHYREAVSRVNPEQKVETWVGIPIAELLKKVSKLNKQSIVVFLLYFQDMTGEKYIPFDVAHRISEASTVPVYSLWTSLLGSGVVGGYMISGEKVGQFAAEQLVSGGTIETQVSSALFHKNIYDWRQLKRWNKSLDALPENSELVYQEKGFWRLYYQELMIVIVVFVLIFLGLRNRELRRYNKKMNTARLRLQQANEELSQVKSRLEQQNKLLQKLSITDRLTDLYNRGHMDDVIYSEYRRAERYGVPLSIILVDVDHFKKVNDSFGHQAGDLVLAKIASTLKDNIRQTDIVGRWGGEEFLIICPNSSEKQTLFLAEKLRAVVESIQCEKVSHITCCFGVSSHTKGISLARFIQNADVALYECKNAGRNCVCSRIAS